MKKFIQLFVLVLIIQSCQENISERESVLDSISYTEDTIYYQIDSLPMLCDDLKIKRQFADIGDCKLFYEITGKGTPMVLINGGPGGTHHCFHPWFSEATEFCKVIYYDQRGCGQSDFNKGEAYTFKQAVEDLDKLRQKLGVEKWIVCGYSYGGGLAQYYSTAYPENTLGMVLIGAASLLHDELLFNTRQFDYISKEEENKIDEIYDMYRNGELSLIQLLYNKDINGDWKRQNFYKPTKDEFIRGALYEWVNDKGFNGIMGNSYGRYDFKDVFNKCPVPTLLCEGKWDLTWTEEKAKLISNNHPNAQFVFFEKSGHSIFIEEPDLFFKTLESFVKTLKPVKETDLIKWKKDISELLTPQEELFQTEAHFFSIIEEQGIDKAVEYYEDVKKKDKETVLFSESGLNSLGYSYINKKEFDTAIEIFKMNVDAYPNSSNVYDSLGEAYLKGGNKEKAKENYKRSIELNPENKNAKKILEEMGE